MSNVRGGGNAPVRARRWYARRLFVAPALLLVLLLAGFTVLAVRARHIDEFTRQWVVRELERRFETHVELARIQVSAFPEMTVAGDNLTIENHNRSDIPPLLHIDNFVFQLGWMGLFDVPRRIRGIKVENMTITIPARRAKGEDQATAVKNDREHSTKAAKPPIKDIWAERLGKIIMGEIVCTNADLIILPKDARKSPLDWNIHHLILRSVGAEKPFHFLGTLTNAKPEGEISTEGDFGPWQLDEPGSTSVSGGYNFTNADLDPFPGIAGTLSSTGTYKGQLDSLEVQGETDTPNFSLDKVGNPVPLHTDYWATVDGSNGDTFLHPVKATLGRSLIIADGSVVKDPSKNGHYISLKVSASNARIEDLLKLALRSEKPLMSGPVRLKASLLLPPGKTKVIQKMILDGSFGVADARWNNEEVQEKLRNLSRHAEGKPSDQDAGSDVSDLRGKFKLAKGEIEFSSLSFGVPGAQINLTGSYDIPGGDMDFRGHLRMRAKLSQTVGGAKSIVLKAFDPFFSKNGAGTELPIAITGTRDNPVFSVSAFHKKFQKKMGSEKKQSAENISGSKVEAKPEF